MISILCLILLCSPTIMLSSSIPQYGSGASNIPIVGLTAKDVTVILASNELDVTPHHSYTTRVYLEGTVEWNVTSAPIHLLNAQVELMIRGIPFVATCYPAVIQLTRSDNIKKFRFTINIPPGTDSGMSDGGMVEGQWTYNEQPWPQQQIDPRPFAIDIKSYSNIFIRGHEGETLRLKVGTWRALPITIANNGNAADVYTIREVGSSRMVETRYETGPVSVQAAGMSTFTIEVRAKGRITGTEKIVFTISTQHPLLNSTAEISLLFLTEGSDTYVDGRTLGISIGIMAFAALTIAAAIWIIRKKHK